MIKRKKKDPPCILALCIIDERLPQNGAFVLEMIIRKSCFVLKFHHHLFEGELFIHILSFIKIDVSDS